MSDYNKEIGRRIYEKRLENGLSRGELLEYVNISEVYLGMIERGKRGTSIEHMVRIADALCMSMDYMILGREKDYDRSGSLNRKLESLGREELVLLGKFADCLKKNSISEAGLKTSLELHELFVRYAEAREKDTE